MPKAYLITNGNKILVSKTGRGDRFIFDSRMIDVDTTDVEYVNISSDMDGNGDIIIDD